LSEKVLSGKARKLSGWFFDKSKGGDCAPRPADHQQPANHRGSKIKARVPEQKILQADIGITGPAVPGAAVADRDGRVVDILWPDSIGCGLDGVAMLAKPLQIGVIIIPGMRIGVRNAHEMANLVAENLWGSIAGNMLPKRDYMIYVRRHSGA
jgi:hypothetical protein